MKRIFFTTQKQINYMPLKVHLGTVSEEEFRIWNEKRSRITGCELQCPKQLTTRPHKMKGEYYVVEGSRYAAYPVLPKIMLEAVYRGQLNLRDRTLDNSPLLFPDSFARADLGVERTTFDDFVKVILSLNKKHTIDTPFYVHRLFPLNSSSKTIEQLGSALSTEPDGTEIMQGKNKQDAQKKRIASQCVGKSGEQKRMTDWGMI